jgi:flagella basal body P-ring formation protein FlgA
VNKVRLALLLPIVTAAALSPDARAAVAAPDAPPAVAAQAGDDWSLRARQIVEQAAGAASAAGGPQAAPRIEVELGRLDPRLRLAPCAQVDVYLPPGHRAWGHTRVGLRCLSGPTRWNVFVPMTVRVFAPAVQASGALPAGTVLGPEHLRVAEADWAATESAPFREPAALLGRTLQRALADGATLRANDLKKRQWFAIGDIVRIVAIGPGFTASADGVALTPGIEGQAARVRTEAGRVVSGSPAGERRLEVRL